MTAPAAPALLGPADEATGSPINQGLTWEASAGALTYGVQVATEDTFATPLVSETGLEVLAYQNSGLANLTEFFWRVNATNGDGTSDWSTVRSFTTIIAAPAVPVLSTPADAAVQAPINQRVAWGAAARAASYAVQVATDDAFSALVVDETGVTDLFWDNAGLTNMEDYYWRAKATNAGGSSDWSAARTFRTIVAAPTLLLPADGELSEPDPAEFSWTEPDGATEYHFQLATDAMFTAIVHEDYGLAVAAAIVAGLDHDTEHFWRVKANSADGWGAWSGTFDFITVVETPAGFVPANHATWVSNPVTFSWDAVPGAITYQIQVASDSGFVSIIWDDATLTDPEYEATGFTANTPYYWRVRATDGDGPSPWSPVQVFISKPAAATTPRRIEMNFIPALNGDGELNADEMNVTGTSQRLALNKGSGDAGLTVMNKSATEIVYVNMGGAAVVATAKGIPIYPLTGMTIPIPEAADYWAAIGSGAAALWYCLGTIPQG